MRLFSSSSSPFVRKIKVLAFETDQWHLITEERVRLSPIDPNLQVNQHNPLGKIPVLLNDDGTSVYDSRVICEYLDSLHTAKKMFPTDERERWSALKNQSLGDGIMDSGVLLRFETSVKPAAFRWPSWYEAQLDKILRALDVLERGTNEFKHVVNIGSISVACALGYLDFRFSDSIAWRESRPILGNWYEEFSNRPSMQSTIASD